VASLQGFNAQDLPAAQAAAAALLSFAEHTQGQALAHVATLEAARASSLIDLPPATHRNLELTQTLRGEKAPTLLSLIDSCQTGMGSRNLRHWLTHPPRDRAPATARHAAIAALLEHGADPLRAALRAVSDVERITARLALRQVRPRELSGLRATLALLPVLRGTLPDAGAARLIDEAADALQPPPALHALLQSAIADEPAVLLRDGGVIATGHDAELDELRAIGQNCDAFLLRPGSARATTLRHRQPAGAVQPGARLLHRGDGRPAGQGARRLPAPPDPEERRALHHARAQGLRGQGAERAATAPWRARSGSSSSCWTQLQAAPAAAGRAGPRAGQRWTCWPPGRTRRHAGWCGPRSCPSPASRSRQGRHPVVQQRLAETGGARFIANDCRLDARTPHAVITGPNMGGKSTFMRQVALIALLASIGLRAGAGAAGWGRSTPSTPASARPTTWPTRSPPSCWR
jgi:DNA mismatch repair protein MutS